MNARKLKSLESALTKSRLNDLAEWLRINPHRSQTVAVYPREWDRIARSRPEAEALGFTFTKDGKPYAYKNVTLYRFNHIY